MNLNLRTKTELQSNLLQLKIEENKNLKKEIFNLKDELHSLSNAVKSLKKVNGLNILTLKKLGYEAVKLGEEWKIKRRGFVYTYYNIHHKTFKIIII